LLAEGTTLLQKILPLLQDETSVIVQHAVIGLLKNLSIPAVNKGRLGEAGVIEKLVEMGVWTSKRDMTGSVQGGAVGVVKNLCRSNRTSSANDHR